MAVEALRARVAKLEEESLNLGIQTGLSLGEPCGLPTLDDGTIILEREKRERVLGVCTWSLIPPF